MRILKFISFLFHPLHFPIAIVLFSFYYIPNTLNSYQEKIVLLFIFISTYIFPLLFLQFLKQLKFINTIYLHTAKERKLPVLFLLFVFFMVGSMFFKLGTTLDLGMFFIANSLALSIIFVFLSKKNKISLHTLGLGGIIGYFIVQSFYLQINFLSILIPLFLLSGIIATTRCSLKAHTEKEIYLGFFIGLFCQLITPIILIIIYRM